MKKIITFALILCMSMTVLAACGGSGSDKGGASGNPGNVYRVVVSDESGASVQGVTVQFCSDALCLKGETDADGIAVFADQEEGSYIVHVLEVPEGYAEDATEYSAPETYGDVNITLKAAQ